MTDTPDLIDIDERPANRTEAKPEILKINSKLRQKARNEVFIQIAKNNIRRDFNDHVKELERQGQIEDELAKVAVEEQKSA